MVEIEKVVQAFAQGDAVRLAEAACQADGALRPAIACMRDVLVYRAEQGHAGVVLPADLVACLDRALEGGPADPDLRMALLSIAVRHALAAAAGRPVAERVAVCDGLLRRGRELVSRCRCLRSRAILPRWDIVLGHLAGDHERRGRAVDALLADPELDADGDLRLEFILHRLGVRLDSHHLRGVEEELATVIDASDRCRDRVGFDPMWLQDFYWYLIGDYERIFATSTGAASLAGRDRRSLVHAYALLAAGHHERVESLLQERHDRLAREGHFARRHSNRAVVYHELRAAWFLAEGRIEEARQALRRCNAAAEDPHGYLSVQLAQAVAIELADSNPQRARASLELLDPTGSRGDCLMAWCRLLLLERDRSAAAQCFARARDRTVEGYLEHQLRFAHELRAADALWLGRQDAPADTSPLAAVVPRRGPDGVTLVGDSAVMARVRREIATFAPLNQTVLITGETGTGKECVARLLHEQGAHPQAPFLPLNCAALPDALAESELFGHARGAFTGADRDAPGLFAAAGEGTVFLDEVASLSPRLQGVLLRVLETGDYRPVGGKRQRRRRCRVVVASNRPLTDAVSEGSFRADLYYRLARFTIDVPPLRQRRDDIAQLCSHFIGLAGGASPLRLGDALLARLRRREWPGNVRELRNEIERLVVLAPGGPELGDDDLFASDAAPVEADSILAAEAVAPPPLADDLPSAPVPIPGVAKARRRRLAILALVRQRGQLARSEVVELLGCATSTATRDLKALQGCGLIERVETSGHLRTSYFVLGPRAERSSTGLW